VSKLSWAELDEPRQAELLQLTTRLLEIRKTYPDFTDPRFEAGTASSDDDAGWLLVERGSTTMVVNFSDSPTKVAVGRELVPLITVGEADVVDGEVHLGPHSGLAAQTLLPPH